MKRKNLLGLICFLCFSQTIAQAPDKTLYVEFFNYSILGNQIREDNLIYYAWTRNINSLILFSTGETFHNYEVQDASPLSFESDLINFVTKAKANGINNIGIAVGSPWNSTYKQANAVNTDSFQILTPDDGVYHSAVSGNNQISSAISLPFVIADLDGIPVSHVFVST